MFVLDRRTKNMEFGKITFIWKENKKFYYRKIQKARLISEFDKIIEEYTGNNEISTQIVGHAYLCSEFYIDWDSEQDVKKLFCYMWFKKKVETIEIIYHHKIVLAKLKEYCNKGVEISYDEVKEKFNILKCCK